MIVPCRAWNRIGNGSRGIRKLSPHWSRTASDNQVQMLQYAVTLGALEQLDLMSAVDYVTGRIDVDPAGIGALGVSLGGSTTLLAAASDPRMKAVVDDSGFERCTERDREQLRALHRAAVVPLCTGDDCDCGFAHGYP